MNRISRFTPALALMLVAVTGCGGGEMGTPETQLTYDQAAEQVNSYIESGKIQYTTVNHPEDNSWIGIDTTAEDLPEIDKYPLSVEGTGGIVVTIASSTEKSHVNGDRWLDLMAKEFNSSGVTVDGQRASVSVRPMASGLALDYITSKKYVPDAYSPANELWIPMIAASGVEMRQIDDRLTGNTAGILMEKSVHDTFAAKYGDVTMPTVIEAVMAGDMRLGHTDPNLSSTGLNMLVQELLAMDTDNPLSPTAVEKFRQFQAKVPPASPTTDEMSKVAARGLANAMIMESQAYKAEPSLATGWVFTPAGVRHDSPLYALGELPDEKVQVLEQFAEFVSTDKAQASATSLGFNQHDEYVGSPNSLSGAQLSGILDVWKANKDAGVPVVSMIVVDRSGSMQEGNKMERARQALLASANHITPSNYVGMITYGSDITLDLPVGEFNDVQRSKFVGAVNALEPNGGTATNSALVAALHEMLNFDAGGETVKYRIILLSDGMQTEGINLNAALQVVGGLKVPVYSISYETDSMLDDMERLAGVSESAYVITVDSDDAPVRLKNLARGTL